MPGVSTLRFRFVSGGISSTRRYEGGLERRARRSRHPDCYRKIAWPITKKRLLRLLLQITPFLLFTMQIAITPQQPPPVNTALYSYLFASPARFSCHLTDSAKKQILRECYASLYGNDPKLIQFLLPNGFDDSLFSLASGDVSSVLDKEEDMPEYSEAQRGRPCGHVLKKGESVYRCR